MGCDIHGVVERRVKGRWVAVKTLSYPNPALERNYVRFAALAGVRGTGPEPRGVPEDLSDTARVMIDDYGTDGHSHSWLPLNEAATIFAQTQYTPDTDEARRRKDYMDKYPASHFFDVESETVRVCPTCHHRDVTGLDDYRLVFWFDN